MGILFTVKGEIHREDEEVKLWGPASCCVFVVITSTAASQQ